MNDLHQYVDYLLLCYHEARNVRRLVAAGCVDMTGWEPLIGLPEQRDEAWQRLQTLRHRAGETTSAAQVDAIVCGEFGKGLQELAEMFAEPHWRCAAPGYGGRAWADIAQAVNALGQALESQDEGWITGCLGALAQMRHNTGLLPAKLVKLDRSLER